jgi:anti-sigma regulatory factor (Ser/Thr protein kinase)
MNGKTPMINSSVDDDKPVIITITLPTQAYFISGIRDFTLEMVKNLTNFSEQWAFRFQSVIDELCNNAIEHGSMPGDDIKVIFECKKGDYLAITVEDGGKGKEKTTPEDLEKKVKASMQIDPAKLVTLRGRGLPHIVANWTDVLEFKKNDQGGISVHIIKYLNRTAPNESSTLGGGQSQQIYQL